jgi:hypothetical protein
LATQTLALVVEEAMERDERRMIEEEVVVHEAPIWRSRANFILAALIEDIKPPSPLK